MISLWPQFLVGGFLLALGGVSIVKHGQPVDPKPISCMDVIWRIFVMAAVLGAGGFWGRS